MAKEPTKMPKWAKLKRPPPPPAPPPCRQYTAFGVLLNSKEIEAWSIKNAQKK